MAYSELIKNFQRVRDYMRAFYVYGFKSRDEYNKKSGRSYDNERRRIESWLGDYMRFSKTEEGKSVFLSIDSRAMPENPLYKAFKTSSFTDRDITLHFILFDILRSPDTALSVPELCERIDIYLSGFDEPIEFDESTVRKKLKEYVDQGIVKAQKDGRKVLYSRTKEDSEIPPLTYAVTVPAEAEEAGYCGNIRSFTAAIPVSVPAVVNTVTNPSSFSGGADRESDTTLRERIRESYLDRPNGMNGAYYRELALEVDGIAKAGVVPKQRGVGTVNVYVAGSDGDVRSSKLAEVQAVMNRARELNVDVLVGNAYSQSYDMIVGVNPKAGYGQAEVVALCTAAFEDYVASIPMGGKLYLSKLGKYLLDTGCLVTYEFDPTMSDMVIPASKYFVAGDVTVEVN